MSWQSLKERKAVKSHLVFSLSRSLCTRSKQARSNLAILPSLENTKHRGFWVESDKVATKMTTMMITVMVFSFCYFRYCFDLNGFDSPPRYGLHVSFTHLPLPSHMLEHCIPQGRLTVPNLFITSDKWMIIVYERRQKFLLCGISWLLKVSYRPCRANKSQLYSFKGNLIALKSLREFLRSGFRKCYPNINTGVHERCLWQSLCRPHVKVKHSTPSDVINLMKSHQIKVDISWNSN